MHTILGAGGPVANALSRQFENSNEELRLLSRKEVKTSREQTSWHKADLLDMNTLRENAKGSKVIYLCAGIVYDSRIWAVQWPKIMENVINLAKEEKARLIFFDNVYMYGQVTGPMTERTPYNPVSKKGEIRARIATMLEDEWKEGNIRGSIARAADFYGSESGGSFVDQLVFLPMSKGKKASWMGNPEALHSLTEVEEAGAAMYRLGQDPATDNQIWHMPTAPALRGTKILEIAAEIFGQNPKKFTRLNYFMLSLAGLGNRFIKESLEMYYQYKYDYVFSSEKFNKYFNYTPYAFKDTLVSLNSKGFYKHITAI